MVNVTGNNIIYHNKISTKKGVFHLVESGFSLYVRGDDEDLIFLGQAFMGIENDWQKKITFYVKKKHHKKSTLYV